MNDVQSCVFATAGVATPPPECGCCIAQATRLSGRIACQEIGENLYDLGRAVNEGDGEACPMRILGREISGVFHLGIYN